MTEREHKLERFALRLRSAREAMHPDVTQRDVANRLGVSFSAVNLWEQGKAFPKVTLLPEISAWFSVSVDWLLGVDNSPRKHAPAKEGEHLLNTVPVVSPSALNRWHWDTALGCLQTEVAYPEGTAAAILVNFDSMNKEVLPGDYAVISKAHSAESGSVVLAAVGKGSEPVLRRYRKEAGESLLIPDDTRYPTIRLDDGARILGVLVETTRRTVK